MPQQSTHKSYYPWLIWGVAAACFFCEYFARVSPGVMVPDLMRDFHVTALALGGLSAFFYYAYVSMQLPVGILVDRFGPRRLLSVTTFLFGIGCLVFASAKTVHHAELGRLLMGFGAAFAFVSSLKLATVWFPAKRFGLLAGMTQSLGMLGGAMGQAPVSYAVSNFGWRDTIFAMALLFMCLAIIVFVIVRDKPMHLHVIHNELASGRKLLAGLRTVLTNQQSWINALYAGLIYSPTAALAELWGASFLSQTNLLTLHEAAFGIGLIFIGWGAGGPLAGWLSDNIGRRRPIMIGSAIACCLLMTCIIYMPGLTKCTLYILLFLYGICNTGLATSYAVASEINPHSIAGTSMAFSNMASVLVGAAFQPLIGALLDMHWTGKIVDGARFYTADNFRSALFLLPICLGVSALIAYFIKETYCKNLEQSLPS